MYKNLTLLFILIVLLAGCNNTSETVSQDDTTSQEETGTNTPELSTDEINDIFEGSDPSPITIANPVNGESVSIALGDSFDDITSQLQTIGLDITSYEYQSTVPTLLDQLDRAVNYQSTDEANANASSINFYIDPENYSFQFIDNGSTKRLTAIIVYNTIATTSQGIRCGDNASKIIEQYGNEGYVLEDEMSTMYIFKEHNNLTLVVDPETELITNWSLNIFNETQQDKEAQIWKDLAVLSSDTVATE